MANGRAIMIVGNGDVAAGQAAAIDAAHVVIRFNTCRSYGVGGTKTDIVAVCNTGRPAASMLDGIGWKTHPAVQQASAIWCTRDSARFAALRDVLAVTHPDLDDLCDDYTPVFRAFAEETGRRFHALSADVHSGLDTQLGSIGAEPYVVPSSGLLVIAEVLDKFAHAGDTVSIAGFDHQGWEWHPFAAEKRLVDSYAAAGRLTRLQSPQNLFLEGA